MADRTFTLDIVTPDRVVLSDTATSLVAPGILGSFGILPNHAPMLSELGVGELRYRRDGGRETRLAIGGGFLQVFDNSVSVLADTAERSDEVDVERARRALELARAAVRDASDARERELAQATQERALNRIKVAGASER